MVNDLFTMPMTRALQFESQLRNANVDRAALQGRVELEFIDDQQLDHA